MSWFRVSRRHNAPLLVDRIVPSARSRGNEVPKVAVDNLLTAVAALP